MNDRSIAVPSDQATATQRCIDILGGFNATAQIVTSEMGYRFSRQAIYAWYVNGHVPFQGHREFIPILVDACQRLHDVTVDPVTLEREVPVPANRIPA